jgi:pyruvate, orthophosphate dikinase
MIQRTDVATESLTPPAGKRVTIDGWKGLIIDGELPVLSPDEDEDAHLRRIASWAGVLSRIPVMAVHAGGETLDFDDHSGNVRSLAQTIGPGNIVKGRIFSNDDSLVRIAIERGAASIVTSPVLPALLAAAHAAQETGKPE